MRSQTVLEAVLASESAGAVALQAYNRTLAALQTGQATQKDLEAAHKRMDAHNAWALDAEVHYPDPSPQPYQPPAYALSVVFWPDHRCSVFLSDRREVSGRHKAFFIAIEDADTLAERQEGHNARARAARLLTRQFTLCTC